LKILKEKLNYVQLQNEELQKLFESEGNAHLINSNDQVERIKSLENNLSDLTIQQKGID
jgi:hypothetical protein